MTLDVMFIVLFAALLHATWNALIKSGNDKFLESIMLCVTAGLMALALLPFLPLPASASWLCLIASTAIHVVYFCLVAFAYRDADLSFVYPLMRGSAPLFTALLAMAALDEPLAWGGWLGILLLCAGVLTLALDGRRAANIRGRVWFIGLGNAAIIVSYTLVDGMGVRVSGNAWSYVLWLFALTALPMLLLGVVTGMKITSLPRSVWRKGFISGACTIGSYGLALWAMTQAPIALVAALRETSVLLGTVIAALILNEKFGHMRWLAASLMLAGAVAMKVL